ncbi:hypothetical protein B0H66DRAFT_640168 [Apodospora peruviana]|uniref:Uncharacterized protein n=1 Tax=Apodospora peruviana TaxID=516989 RepID=A0AAE0I5F1_9PEZI|nr:hypothetical protein B0H66DRAFT_640168 [Apodospora peruviana]
MAWARFGGNRGLADDWANLPNVKAARKRKAGKVDKNELEDEDFVERLLAGAGSGQPTKLVIMFSDALIDGRKPVTNAVRNTFAANNPEREAPTKSEILSVLASGPQKITEAFTKLNLKLLPPVEHTKCTDTYVEFLAQEMFHLYVGAADFLRDLARRKIPVLVITDHPDLLVKLLTEEKVNGCVDFILDGQISYIHKPEALRNAIHALMPKIYKYNVEKNPVWLMHHEDFRLKSKEMVMVSCSLGNLKLAKAINARTCLVKKAEGVIEIDADKPDFEVNRLLYFGRMIHGPTEPPPKPDAGKRAYDDDDSE